MHEVTATEPKPSEFLCALCPALSSGQLAAFDAYAAMLLDWNTRMNLTAITDVREIAEKHFADSLAAAALLPVGASVADVGTGAGFPGVPLLIARPDLRLTLIDGLNKRITFLTALLAELGLEARCVHMRAEDAGRDARFRGQFDASVTRAVASLPVLIELTVPLLRVGGVSIAYKGDAAEELAGSKSALHLLNSRAETVEVPAAYGKRTLVCITKREPTPKAYPRRAGTPEKKPL